MKNFISHYHRRKEKMAKKTIVDYLDDLEIYVDTIKLAPLSPKKIYVDKEELMTMIQEVKLRLPGEMERSQKIVHNKDGILQSAKEEAESIVSKAKTDAAAMVEESEIVKNAQIRAEELIETAKQECKDMVAETQEYVQSLLDQARDEAKQMRSGALYYTTDTLSDIENYIKRTLEENSVAFQNLSAALNQSLDVISANRLEIDQQIKVFQQAEETTEVSEQEEEQDTEALEQE